MSTANQKTRVAVIGFGIAFTAIVVGFIHPGSARAQSVGDADPIRIGLIADQTGALAPVGTGISRGALIAQEIWNAQPDKRKIEITPCDSQSTGVGALGCYQRLKASVDALSGPHLFLGIASVRGAAEAGAIPIMSAAPVAAPPSAESSKSNIFQDLPTFEDGVHAGLTYLANKGLKRVAVIAQNDVAGRLATEAAQKLAPSLGVTLVRVEAFDPQAQSLAPQAENIAAAKPQAVLASILGSQLITGLRALKSAGVEVPLMLNYAAMSSALLESSGPAAGANLLFFATKSFDPQSIQDPPHRKRVIAFVEAFQTRYKLKPDFTAFVAADTVLILAAAGAEKAGPKAIGQTLVSGSVFSGVLWPSYQFSPSKHVGQTGKNVFDILQWQPGRLDWKLAP